jgi:hypothetical protein
MLYNDFYRKYGVRNFEKFKDPNFTEIGELVIPKESLVHYIPTEETENGPDQTGPMFNGRDSSHAWHIEELTSDLGRPRHRASELRARLKAYHKRNRKIRNLRKFEQGTRDLNNLVTINYALLPHVYNYTRSALSTWNEWSNINRTVWDSVAKYTSETMRHQFIHIETPDVLPTMDELKKLSKKPTLESLDSFRKVESLYFFYLWQYCTQGTHELDTILGENIKMVNLVFMRGGKFSVLNMGSLQEWKRKEHDLDGDRENGVFDKAFIRYITLVQQLETVTNATEEDFTEEDLDLSTNVFTNDKTAIVEVKARELRDSGQMSLPEYKRAVRLANSFKTIKATNGSGTLEEQATVSKSDLAIPEWKAPDLDGVLDKEMLKSSLKTSDAHYIDKVLEKDVGAMVLNVQNTGVAVTGFTRETVIDAANRYEHYSIQMTPLGGKPSTVHIRLPTVNKEGKFKANGVVYHMAKQRGDLPIRKTKADTVALTSYYGKLFVNRSAKAVYDRSSWMRKKIIHMGVDESNVVVTSVRQGDASSKTVKLPHTYSGMSNGILGFTCASGDMSFEHDKRESLYGTEALKNLEKRGHIICGKKGNNFITLDEAGVFYTQSIDGSIDTIGTLSKLLNVDLGREPNDMAEVKIYSTGIPVGVMLGYMLGFSKLLNVLKVKNKIRMVPKGQRVELDEGEASIVFKDETLVYPTDNPEVTMILNGFYEYRTAIKGFTREEFDKKQVYQPVLESRGIGLRFIREMDLLEPMFIDPITDGILEERKEPRTFPGLLIKSVELLKDDRTPDETDTEYMRIKGYERMPGFIYKELVSSIRKQQSKPMSTQSRIEMNPKAVWMSILKDASTKTVEELNPIHNLKEKELVTYSGDGGRSARSMVAGSRVYHKNDMGVISEATVDSGSVAINTYLTANPNFTSVRGTTSKISPNESSATKLLSTSAILSPGACSDDPKRTNFISIQHSHGVASENYKVMPLTTGYEQVLAHRVDAMFANVAEMDGVITNVSDKHVTVDYKDGPIVQIEVGTIYGTVNGTNVPQRIMTDMTKHQKFKAGHVLTWNTGFFDRDYFDDSQVNWKAGALVNVALMESVDTLEDSCAVSSELGAGLSTEMTVIRNIVLDFNQGVLNLVKVGDEVDLETILCTLEDQLTADNSYFDSESMDSLKALGQLNPKAKNKGLVEKIEVLYNGEAAEMSKSLRTVVNRADKERAERVKLLESGESLIGKVNEPINVEGRRLVMDQAVIKIYITKSIDAGVGDKAVLGNQLKTIIGRVMTGTNETESGEPIDVIFGRQSIANRIVLSPDIMGTTNRVLEVLSKKVADTYFTNL